MRESPKQPVAGFTLIGLMITLSVFAGLDGVL